MPDRPLLSAVTLAVVAALMLAELYLSRRNERALLRRGAVEPPDPVFATMRWAYPAVFVAMAVEGMLGPPAAGTAAPAGFVLFAIGKALKFWAIGSLGDRWTYRVLVLPGAPLVTGGPYRFLRHPNYVGVLGEIVGVALITGARLTGPLGTLFFSWLLWKRIAAEERAMGLR